MVMEVCDMKNKPLSLSDSTSLFCLVPNITHLGSVAEWLARRTRDLEVAGSIPDQVML